MSKIYQYDLKGNFVAEYNNVLEATYKLKLNTGNIYSSLKGNKKYTTVANSYWSKKYYTKYPKELMKKERRKVCQYDIDMNLIREYDRAIDACEYGFDKVGIALCLSEKHYQKTHRDYIWKYKD